MPQAVLLGAAVAAVLLGHRAVRPAASVAVAVLVGLATGIVDGGDALDALDPLAAPLGFLAAAVPVAVLLDRVGFFEAAAEWVAERPFGQGPRLVGSLWALAALVTTLFNLDAAIVLLTPLYVRIALRHGLDPVRLGFQPVLLASLASSALPVSNLTNLIVAEARHADVADFLVRLGPASLAATCLGWFTYRTAWPSAGPVVEPVEATVDVADPSRTTPERVLAAPSGAPVPTTSARHRASVDAAVSGGSRPGTEHARGGRAGRRIAARRAPVATGGARHAQAWRVGGPAVGVLLVGFTLGDAVGIPAWAVAVVVAAGLAVATRSLPVRALPVEALVVAGGLAVLAAAAVPHLGLDRLLAGTGALAEVRAFAAGVVGANAVNNLPALLVGLPNVEGATSWAYLLGVNVGPVLWISGSLAGLLWADVMARHGHPVTPGEYARVGVRVGLPALLVAGIVAVGLGRLF